MAGQLPDHGFDWLSVFLSRFLTFPLTKLRSDCLVWSMLKLHEHMLALCAHHTHTPLPPTKTKRCYSDILWACIVLSNSFVHTGNHMKYSKQEFFGTCTYSSDSTSISCGMVTDYDHISYSSWKYFPFIKHEIFGSLCFLTIHVLRVYCTCCI